MKSNSVIDPICGMTIDPKQAAGSSTYEGETFYFCATACKTRFDADPKQYAEKVAAPGCACACH